MGNRVWEIMSRHPQRQQTGLEMLRHVVALNTVAMERR